MTEENTPKKKSDIVIPREVKLEAYKSPDCLSNWDDENILQTPEYKAMLDDISSICDYLCKQLNEGPETKDSFTKRILTLRAIIRFLLQRTFLNNFMRLGMIEQVKFDILYNQELSIMAQKYAKEMEAQQKRTRDYAD